MKNKKCIGGVLLASGFLALCIYNLVVNDDFFKAPLTTIISILVAIVLSYFLSQRKTDDRRKREKIDKLLYKIQGIVLDEKFIEVKETDLITQRSIVNKILDIEENATSEIRDDVGRLKEIFQEYRDFYSNHYTDDEYMKKSRIELTNFISRIDDLCDRMHMKLM